MLVGLERLRPSIVGAVLGVLMGACGPETAPKRCYDVWTPNPDDLPPNDFRVCGQRSNTNPQFAEFDDRWLVWVERAPNDDGTCAMCAEDLDPLFWDAFLEEIEKRGLAADEDPDCVDQGYAIELACRVDDGSAGTCKYQAYVASNCTLGGGQTP